MLHSKLLFCCIVLLFATVILTPSSYGQWTPPKNPAPFRIYLSAKGNIKNGNYEKALDKYRWLFHKGWKLEKNSKPTKNGRFITRSHLADWWWELSTVYPPAKKEYESALINLRKIVLSKNAEKDDSDTYSSFCTAKGDHKSAASCFEELTKRNPEFAVEVYRSYQESLIRQRKFYLCSMYLAPEAQRVSILSMLKMPSYKNQKNLMIRESLERVCSKGIQEILDILVETKQFRNAKEIYRKSKAVFENLKIRDESLRKIETGFKSSSLDK